MRPSFVCALVARMGRPSLEPRTGRAPLAPDAYRVRQFFVCAFVARSTPLEPRIAVRVEPFFASPFYPSSVTLLYEFQISSSNTEP